jgi:hypothetical protein
MKTISLNGSVFGEIKTRLEYDVRNLKTSYNVSVVHLIRDKERDICMVENYVNSCRQTNV